MAIELSNLTFTELDDIVPASGEEEIVNNGIANTLAGDDIITGTLSLEAFPREQNVAIYNVGSIYTSDGNDTIAGINDKVLNAGGDYGIRTDEGTIDTGNGSDIITGITYRGDGILAAFTNINTGDGNDTIAGTTSLDSRGIYLVAGSLDTGRGDDIITGTGSFAGLVNTDTFLDTDEGNDIIAGNGSGSAYGYGILNEGPIDTGDDNDTITGTNTNIGGGWGILNSDSIYSGNGNDIITGIVTADSEDNFSETGIFNRGSSFINSIIDTGNGDDVITGIGSINGIENYGIINTGNGEDSLLSHGKFINSGADGVFLGDGNDIISVTYTEDIFGRDLENLSIIETGDGNDIINSSGFVYSEGTINTGNGQDSIISQNTTNLGGMFLGDGNDIINSANGISNFGTINAGNGQDSIISQGRGTLGNFGEVFLEDGNDSLVASIDLYNYRFIGTGDGNDIITTSGVLYNYGVIETGNGDDSIIVNGAGTTYAVYNNGGAIINMGDGNDSIIANQGFGSTYDSNGTWFLGEGEDYLNGFGSGEFSGGNGNDTLELTSGTYTVGRWYTAVTFTKGSSIMITSEFEKLIAGSTTYDFSSLTRGQAITVA